MGRYTTIAGQTLRVQLESDVKDNGWVVYSGYAEHAPCNAGYIRNTAFQPTPGKTYQVKFSVFDRTSGSVNIVFGGINGDSITQNGEFTQEFTAINSDLLFWSDGALKIRGLVISEVREVEEEKGYTITFNTKNMQWTGYKSYVPEFTAKFVDNFFGFKDGELWKHNATEIRNNFYGEQYKSAIEFYVNLNPTQIKNFHTMRVKSNLPWAVPKINILPRAGKSNGQRSRIKKGNFKNLQGDWFAEFLRDINDPRFSSEQEALFMGALLQGGVASIRIENDDTVEVRLLCVDVEISEQNYTF